MLPTYLPVHNLDFYNWYIFSMLEQNKNAYSVTNFSGPGSRLMEGVHRLASAAPPPFPSKIWKGLSKPSSPAFLLEAGTSSLDQWFANCLALGPTI